MEEIKIGTRVVFVHYGKRFEGTVRNCYQDINIAIVETVGREGDIGHVFKIPISDLFIISEHDDQEKKDKSEPITITPTEFKQLTDEVISKTLIDSEIGRMLSVFCELLQQELFINNSKRND